MTKREIIKALEDSECEDNCAVYFRDDAGYLHEIELVGKDQQGSVILSGELGK